MKIRANRTSNRVVVEVTARDPGFPAVPVPELAIRRILAPVDFSPCSRKALRYATLFAKQFNAELMLLHVMEPLPPQVAFIEGVWLDVSVEQSSAEQLSKWREEEARGITAKELVRNGPSAQATIVATAEEINADLIIIGNEGRRGVARAFMGSTAERVVRHAPCPVLVIRKTEHDFIEDERRDNTSVG